MSNNIKSNAKGFTILELMIASTVFSVILLLCTVGIIQIGKTYYKGTTISRTQSVARDVMDRISQEIQFGSSEPENPASVVANTIVSNTSAEGVFCIGSTRYTYKKNNPVGNDPTDHALVADTYSVNCDNPGFASALGNKGKELLAQGMRLAELEILTSSNGYKIKIRVTQGGGELVGPNGNCKSGAGSQFCGSSYLETTVQRRL